MPKTIKFMSDRLEHQREEVRFRVLRLIENNPEISQRELADELGVSLGQINYQLRALKESGLIKVVNFLRSDNKLAYLYLLTPSGAANRLATTKRFLAQKRYEYILLKNELRELELEMEKMERTKLKAESKFKKDL